MIPNKELNSVWYEAVVPNSWHYLDVRLEGLRRSTKHLIQYDGYAGRCWRRTHSECTSQVCQLARRMLYQ